MLEWLQATDSHPTAAQIQLAVSSGAAGVSLATVYRNLEVLLGEGRILEVVCEGGPARYDGNVEPHHHFTCEGCACIVDVAVSTPRGMTGRLAAAHGLRATRVSIQFFGLCGACDPDSSPSHSRGAA